MRRPLRLSRLASKSSKESAAAASLSLRDIRPDARSVRLSFQQQRIYVLSRLDPTGYNYHIVEVARLSGPLDPDALEASIATICERHEVLRSIFLERLGEPMQTVGTARPRLERLDLRPCAKSGTSGGDSNAQTRNCCANLSILKRSRRCELSC